MKKLVMSILVFCVMCFGCINSDAAEYGVYVEPNLVFDFSQANYLKESGSNSEFAGVTNFGGGVAIGYDFLTKFNVPVRVEAEYIIRTDAKFDYNDKSRTVHTPQTLFANAYLDFVNNTDFTPYMGGGVGASIINADMNFAWNAGAGVAWNFAPDWDLDLGYRYVSFGDFEADNADGIMSAHEIQLGLRYTF